MHHLNDLEELFHHFFHWNRARIRCIVPLIIGMIQLGTVNLSKIAATFPGTAQSASHYKRLQRLFRQFPLDLDQIARVIAYCKFSCDSILAYTNRSNLFSMLGES